MQHTVRLHCHEFATTLVQKAEQKLVTMNFQISKYRNVVNFSTRFFGDIGDIENKTLSNVKELLLSS